MYRFVNSICGSRRGDPIVVTASDDGTSKLFDIRSRGAFQELKDEKAQFPILSACFSDDSTQVFTGGIDEHIKVEIESDAQRFYLTTQIVFSAGISGEDQLCTDWKATKTV